MKNYAYVHRTSPSCSSRLICFVQDCVEILDIGLEQDIEKGLGEAEQQPQLHQLDEDRLGQRVGNTHKPD
jgi:hypothetical protein